jgi:hypothetical protein
MHRNDRGRQGYRQPTLWARRRRQGDNHDDYSVGLLAFTAAYTYSKSIDDGNARTNQYDASTGRGPSSFDIGQRFVISGTYEVPFGEGRRWLTSGLASHILGGWQLTPVFQKQSGQPLTATLSGNFSNSGGGTDRPNLVGDPNENAPHTIQQWFDTSVFQLFPPSGQAGAPYSFGNAGVGVIRGPGLTNFDLSLAKNVKLGARATLQLRAEMFNVFNTTNWGLPGLTANTSTFGVISTAGDPRLTQFSAKLAF